MSADEQNTRSGSLRGNIEAYVLIVLMVLSVAFVFLVPFQIPEPKISFGRAIGQIEPTLFPRLAATGLFVTSSFALFQSIRRGGGNPFKDISRAIAIQLGVIIAILWLFALIFEPLGYWASGIVISLMLSLYLGNRNWIALIVLCAGIPTVIYYIFTRLLLISLPEGILY